MIAFFINYIAKLSKRVSAYWPFLIILIGILLRLYLANGAYNLDIKNFIDDINIINSGKNIYTSTVYYNYSPLFLIFLKFADIISNLFLISKEYAIRILLVLIDCAILLVLKVLNDKRLSRKQSYTSLVFFALNPVSVILTGHHGQFENLALLFLLLGYMLSISNSSTKWIFLSVTTALCIKQSIVFLVLYFFLFTFRFKRGIVLFMLSCIIFLCLFIPFLSADSFIRIKDQVFGYSGLGTFYGISYFLEQIFGERYRPYQPGLAKYIFMFLTTTFVFYKAKNNKRFDLLLISLFFLTFTTGIGDQYFVVPIIIAAMRPNFFAVMYSLGCFLYLLGSPSQFAIPMFETFSLNFIWFLTASWFLNELFERKSPRIKVSGQTEL